MKSKKKASQVKVLLQNFFFREKNMSEGKLDAMARFNVKKVE